MFSLGSFVLAGFVADVTAVQVTKMIHNKIEKQEIKDTVLNEGLYHFAPDSSIEKIMESKELRTSKGWVINNFGKNKAYMFAGVPEFDIYLKNIKSELDPMLNDVKEVSAVKINIKEEQLDRFKTRNLNDGAIVHEGHVDLDDKEVEVVTFVIDLDKDGKFYFREKTKDEIENGYTQSEELQKKLSKDRGGIAKASFRSLKIENQEAAKNTSGFLKEKWNQLKQFWQNKKNNVKALPEASAQNEISNDFSETEVVSGRKENAFFKSLKVENVEKNINQSEYEEENIEQVVQKDGEER